jgi:hypothetical protein
MIQVLLLAAAVLAAPVRARADPGYRPVQTVVTPAGSIQILQDDRLDPALTHQMWTTCVDPGFVLGDKDARAQVFEKTPLRPAKLRQADGKGRVVLDAVLEKEAPIARVESRRLGAPDDPVLLVTTDNAACMGSYSGLSTSLYRFQGGRLSPVQALAENGEATPVALFSTLKSGWRTIESKPGRTVIEEILCRPDFEHDTATGEAKFLLSYITYWSDGRAWRKATRTTPGYWEGEGPWPARSNFPQAR